MDPGKTHTYVWEIQQNQGPTDGDSPCLTHSYSSNIDSVKDTNSGLIGALLVCRPGKSNPGWGHFRCSHGLRGRGIRDTPEAHHGSGVSELWSTAALLGFGPFPKEFLPSVGGKHPWISLQERELG